MKATQFFGVLFVDFVMSKETNPGTAPRIDTAIATWVCSSKQVFGRFFQPIGTPINSWMWHTINISKTHCQDSLLVGKIWSQKSLVRDLTLQNSNCWLLNFDDGPLRTGRVLYLSFIVPFGRFRVLFTGYISTYPDPTAKTLWWHDENLT